MKRRLKGQCTMLHYMTGHDGGLAIRLGQRIHKARVARKWTLDQMAEASSVSRRMIVMVEKGQTNPSVTTLLRLSDALGMGLPTLVAERNGVPASLTRAGNGTTLWTSEQGGSGVLLAGTPSPDVLELWTWTLQPLDIHESPAHTPGTREILHVSAGAVTLKTGLETIELAVGDTYAFDGDQRHSYANTSDHQATFTLAVFEPDVGTKSAREEPS
jgi:transcriptional regulator with XRE-family HTH domain